MNSRPISEAKDPDLRNIDIALKRAAVRAREIAKRCGTPLVVNREGKTILVNPDELQNSSSEASK